MRAMTDSLRDLVNKVASSKMNSNVFKLGYIAQCRSILDRRGLLYNEEENVVVVKSSEDKWL